MGEFSGAGLGGAFFAVTATWSLVGLLIYVWYLWSLARLFPFLGLPAAHGWIPVYNQWRLVERGGLPGWLVLLGFLPPLSIVVVVASIIAIHRINQEHNEGAGMTVLGAFIAPLWATLLGSKLAARGAGPRGYAAGPHAGLVEYGPNGQVFPVLGAQQPGQQAPAYGMPPVPPLPPMTQPQPPSYMPAAPAAVVSPPMNSQPVNNQPVQPQDAQGRGEEPAGATDPLARLLGGAEHKPADRGVWGLGRTVDNNFERLANEALPQRDATFGANSGARPFSWPEPQPAAPMPIAQQPPMPPAPPIYAPPEASVPVSEASVPAPEVPVLEESVPEVEIPGAGTPDVTPDVVLEATPIEAPLEPIVPEPVELSTADDMAGEIDDLDHTVVVTRRARWQIVLPDGASLDLEGDDIVLGRRPTAIDDSSVLLIPDATRTLSKSHARLRRSGEEWTIEDLNSTNGVFIFDAEDTQIELVPGNPQPVSSHLIIGTLEVEIRTTS